MEFDVEVNGESVGKTKIPVMVVLTSIAAALMVLMSFIGNAIVIAYGPFIGTIIILVSLGTKSYFWFATGLIIIIWSLVQRRRLRQ